MLQLFMHFVTQSHINILIRISIMSNINSASSQHKLAAGDHEEAAKHHIKAAECHDQNKISDAKESAKSAMDCCNKAQKHTETACSSSAK